MLEVLNDDVPEGCGYDEDGCYLQGSYELGPFRVWRHRVEQGIQGFLGGVLLIPLTLIWIVVVLGLLTLPTLWLLFSIALVQVMNLPYGWMEVVMLGFLWCGVPLLGWVGFQTAHLRYLERFVMRGDQRTVTLGARSWIRDGLELKLENDTLELTQDGDTTLIRGAPAGLAWFVEQLAANPSPARGSAEEQPENLQELVQRRSKEN